jgi:hypothetical protein
MLRWILLLALIGCVYWLYQRGDFQKGLPTPIAVATPDAHPTREGSGRLGGGLNPFVTDTDIDAPPQRP